MSAHRAATVHIIMPLDDLRGAAARVYAVAQQAAGARPDRLGPFVETIAEQIPGGGRVELRCLDDLGAGGKIRAKRRLGNGSAEIWFDMYQEDADARTDMILDSCDDLLLTIGPKAS